MKALRTIALLALSSILAVRGEAGEVHWDTFEGTLHESFWIDDGTFEGSKVPAYSIHSYGVFGTPEVFFVYTINRSGRITSATPFNMTNVGVPMAYWVWAQAGEILTDLSDFKEHDLVYECHCDAIHDDVTGDGISLSSSTETYYLALLGGENFDEYWGWVELEGNRTDGLSVVSSALSKDGPLIVGGGLAYSDPIPEPTSGLLLFVGSAFLLIRRRS